MELKFLSSYEQVRPFLTQIRLAADSNREALGFLPSQVYEDHASQEKLWVAVNIDESQYLGHLLYGGSYPTLRIIQAFVAPECRKYGVGSRLVNELIRFGEEHGYSLIRARVAADLVEANSFWEQLGFKCVRQVSGGRTTQRIINIRIRDLDVPRLFDFPDTLAVLRPESVFETAPELRSLSYVLDVNAIVDLEKKRPRYEAVRALVRAGLSHQVRILVTDEIQKELSRYSLEKLEGNSTLEVARQFPVLPAVDRSLLQSLVGNLRAMVFLRRSLQRRGAERDQSDLIHLATCIHHRVTGFVTSESAILRAGPRIKAEYGLDIVSPYDFVDWEEEQGHSPSQLMPRLSCAQVEVGLLEDRGVSRAGDFLERLSLDEEEVRAIINPGSSGSPRVRWCLRSDEDVVGVVSWSRPSKLRREVDLFCYIDETQCASEAILDHIFEAVARQRTASNLYIIRLRHGPDQPMTRRVARERGFFSSRGVSGVSSLVKVAVPGVISEEDWKNFVTGFDKVTKLRLEATMPSFAEVRSRGLRGWQGRKSLSLDYFDLERSISPGIVLYPGREGVMIPIRECYADELLGGLREQLTLLPVQEALLRGEKAYFRSSKGADRFWKGMLILFYVSRGRKEAVGVARITSTSVASWEAIGERYRRQGVLSDDELKKIADRQGLLHVVTFDNFNRFPRGISYQRLKEMNCVGPTNLVSAEPLKWNEVVRLFAEVRLGG